MRKLLLATMPLATWLIAAPAWGAQTRFGVDDIPRLADLTGPALSPDGDALAYTVSTANRAEDKTQSDLWRVGYDGRGRVRLTDTPKHSEWRAQWSPDGKSRAGARTHHTNCSSRGASRRPGCT